MLSYLTIGLLAWSVFSVFLGVLLNWLLRFLSVLCFNLSWHTLSRLEKSKVVLIFSIALILTGSFTIVHFVWKCACYGNDCWNSNGTLLKAGRFNATEGKLVVVLSHWRPVEAKRVKDSNREIELQFEWPQCSSSSGGSVQLRLWGCFCRQGKKL